MNLSLTAFIAAIACAVYTAAGASEIYVSPTGKDTNPGTKARPLATLGAAQRAARSPHARSGHEPTTVFLRGGVYYLPETLVFTAADSGTKAAPVTYEAYPGEQPVISGGIRLNLKWQPYKNGIFEAGVPSGLGTDQLFVNGERQILARYPNYNPNERIFHGYAADAWSPERAAKWADPEGGYMHAMHEAMWGGFSWQITGKDTSGNLTYEGGWQNNRPAPPHHDYRFVEGIFEELDAPGEWYLNRKTQTLYYYPPANVHLDSAVIEAVRLKHLVEFRGSERDPVRFVNLKGITFRHTLRTFMENREPLLRSDWTTYRGGAILFDGAQDCALENSFLDQVGGNAIFINCYNRRLLVRGCHIARSGGNGIAFVGDPAAARSPNGWTGQASHRVFAEIDKTPGPRGDNYPADCTVEQCLIHETGQVEKQTAPIQISMSSDITIRHCSLYDVPRAGINIGDGCWGGHLIEFCDIFDTVKETGDHGSFNSWARDRWWGTEGIDLQTVTLGPNRDWPRLDIVKPNVLRNNRWRCDHGWDIDLDDGSTNYIIENNLCLNGGIKNREGFYRTVTNNVIVNNSFHPHVWYNDSQDVFTHNIVMQDHYNPAGGMPNQPWGSEMDYNLVDSPGLKTPRPAAGLAAQSRRDAHSVVADAQFIDAAHGDFRVRDGSPAIALGFKNFPMDQFGVTLPELKKIARTPEIPAIRGEAIAASLTRSNTLVRPSVVFGAIVRNIVGPGERSAYGLPDESGVLIVSVPTESAANRADLLKDDVVTACDGNPCKTVSDLSIEINQALGRPLTLRVFRHQMPLSIRVTNYFYFVVETANDAQFARIPIVQTPTVLPLKLQSSGPTFNEPLATLTNGLLERNYGPVFGNGVLGAYKAKVEGDQSGKILQINSWTFNQNGNRGRQRFVIYGSRNEADPGWNLSDLSVFTPLASVDTGEDGAAAYVAVSVRAAGDRPIGSYQWLVWALLPVTDNAGGENSAFQELQVIKQ